MSDIWSENDCRNPLEGERGVLGPSTDMSGEERVRERREKAFPHTFRKRGQLYAIRTSNDQVPAMLVGSHPTFYGSKCMLVTCH